MKINIDSIIPLIEFFRNDYFNKEQFKKLIKTNGMKGFLEQERSKGRNINIREEIEKIIFNSEYKDEYGFYKFKKNLDFIEKDIKKIKTQEKYIIEKALEKNYKIIPKEMKIKCKIYLYFGGEDGGFTVSRNKIYINYGMYMNNLEELIKILSHELYHCRNISYKNRICFSFKTFFDKYGKIYEIIGKILEEGLAALVQHGNILKIDDPAGTLSNRSLLLIKDEFELLNNIILDIKKNIPYNKKLKKLNLYAIGYYIVSTIYNTDGVLILDNWTVELKYEEILKRYIEICNEKNLHMNLIEI